MAVNTIDSKKFATMFLAGAKNLEAKKEWINELNVFPVPDGDTGTNMTLTIMSACKEVQNTDLSDMQAVCKAISSGSLRGARGNSGVILSQLLRGMTKVVKTTEEIDLPTMADAFDNAVETAYKAVMKPKEGTILTVAKGAAQKSRELVDGGETDFEHYFEEVIKYADEVLLQTPEMLPVLKQAGVVDSGGQGLMQVLKGAYDAFMGKEVSFDEVGGDEKSITMESKPSLEAQAEAEIKFGYCTEFIILLNKTFNVKQEMDFKAYLESIGDSIVCVADEDVVKVHVHTNDPGLAIQRALKYGALSNMKIDNMRLEHQEKLFKAEMTENVSSEPVDAGPRKEVGFVAVSVGDGINEIFKSLGVDVIIEGGQTMNPSTADVIDAIDKVNADTVFVMPNNKNIILAAEQAVHMVEDKNIVVIPTKTVPQGITAVINYMPESGWEDNKDAMIDAISIVKTGQVTYAVRDTEIDDHVIKEGDYMGIGDQGILTNGTDRIEITKGMIDELVDEDVELISIYYGADVDEEEANALRDDVEAKYSSCDVELQQGGQPIYYYIVSAE